ncbi:hypothetical protein AX15_000632 [Amanita polypyramis BW_CC]|nr:hypothetical protein AX15_000632 [Amanita polypyramis BW_CC]
MAFNLPPIQVDNNIDYIYTSKHLRLQDSPGHALGFIGERLLNSAIACHWYKKSPGISPQELQEKQEQSLSDELLGSCIMNYNLHNKLARDDEDISLEDCRDFLNVYVGALFVENDFSVVQRWVSALIDPTAEPFPSAPNNTVVVPPTPSASSSIAMPSPSPSTQTLPSYSAPVNDDLSYVTLSLFNEYATQRRNCTVTWQAEHAGEAHRLIWTVRCVLNDEVKGMGVGSSQKLAREQAARETWKMMGWSAGAMTGAPSTPRPPSEALSPLSPSPVPLLNFSNLSMNATVNAGGNTLDFVTVSRFNELAMQRGHRIRWETKSTGQPHMPTWQVTCIVDENPRGVGIGKNTKEAKQQAARDAWKNLLW